MYVNNTSDGFSGGNQRELARQKNAKKQNDSGKGKRQDDGLSAAARKQRYNPLTHENTVLSHLDVMTLQQQNKDNIFQLQVF